MERISPIIVDSICIRILTSIIEGDLSVMEQPDGGGLCFQLLDYTCARLDEQCIPYEVDDLTDIIESTDLSEWPDAHERAPGVPSGGFPIGGVAEYFCGDSFWEGEALERRQALAVWWRDYLVAKHCSV